MKLSDLIPSLEDLNLVQGVEADLLRRKRTGNISGIIALVAAIFQIILVAITREEYLDSIGGFVYNLTQWMAGKIPLAELFGPEGIPLYQMIGLLVVVVGVGLYLLFRWTGFLLHESEEPFRYTLSINPFQQEGIGSDKRAILVEQDRFELLHHDLIQRINQRFKKRFSLLAEGATIEGEAACRSHIQISGYYAIRQNSSAQWIAQVMPRVKIGSPEQPEVAVDPPVEYPLIDKKSKSAGYKKSTSTNNEPIYLELPARDYDWIVEQVYSRIATEVYRQIELDLQDKIRQFPTRYLRAVALSNEAEDFARSNTVDAYDRAIALFQEARRYIRQAGRDSLANRLIRLPVVWRLGVKYMHSKAAIQIGYAKALIYRREISALTGRSKNPIFGLTNDLGKLIEDLRELYHRMTGIQLDEPGQASLAFLTVPGASMIKSHRRVLFDACTVAALAYDALGDIETARQRLRTAMTLDPQLAENNALYTMVEALSRSEMETRIRLLRRAVEMADRFEFAQYQLALWTDMQFRKEIELTEQRAAAVLAEYEEVLKINPGNIAALAAQGYLYWLLEDDQAERKFKEGLKIKAIVRETYVGVLNYGLARVAAEKGRFNTSYNAYRQAVSIDPGVATYSATSTRGGESLYYDYISPGIRDRYKQFAGTVEAYRQGRLRLDHDDGKTSNVVKQTVLSFALSDYGNACINFYWRYGDRQALRRAIEQFEAALKESPDNKVVWYNLAGAHYFQGDLQQASQCSQEMIARMPDWQPAVLANIRYSFQPQLDSIQKELENVPEDIEGERTLAAKAVVEAEELQGQLEELLKKKADDTRRESQSRDMLPKPPRQQEAPSATRTEDIQPRIDSLRDQIKEKMDEASKHNDQALRLEQERPTREKDLRASFDEAFRSALANIAGQTRLSSLLGGLNIDSLGTGVEELLANEQIRWDRLTDDDVEVFYTWAEILSHNFRERQALRRSEILAKHIMEEHYPASFRASTWVRATLKHHLKLIGNDLDREVQAAGAHQPAKRAIDCWLEQDFGRLLFEEHFEWTRLAEDGDNTFRSWAESVVAGENYHLALSRAERLAEYALREQDLQNRNDYQLARQTLRRWSKLVEEALDTEIKRAQNDQLVRKAIEIWLQLDPTHYLTLLMHRSVFDLGRHRKELDQLRSLAGVSDILLESLAEDHIHQALKYAVEGEHSEAVEQFKIAIELVPSNPQYYRDLADAWLRLEETDKAIEALRQAVKIRPQPEHEKRLKELVLSRQFELNYGKKKETSLLPLVTPIAMEVAADLIPYFENPITNQLKDDFKNHLEQMRKFILDQFGVRVPGLRVRGNETDLPQGTYIIMINEIPLVSGSISRGARLFPGSSYDLAVLGISGVETINPTNGLSAFWIHGQEDWDKIETAGYGLWEFVEYPVRHLQAVVRKNLRQFVGHQEIMNLVEERTPEYSKRLEDAPAVLADLTQVLRSLLDEEVPIVELDTLLSGFFGMRETGLAVWNITEALRSLPEIRPTLLGNNRNYVFYRMSSGFESLIEESIQVGEGHPNLDMKPGEVQEALGAVREVVESYPDEALVVEKAEIRPYVRELVQLEFPNLPVLSFREFFPHLEGRTRAEIEYLG
jgi:tetratricopeptide (TPR) repeat protein